MNTRRRTRMNSNLYYYRFILYQIRRIISDTSGDIAYCDEFDRIIYDFYGVKSFSKKLVNGSCYYEADYMNHIDRIGMPKLLALLKDKRYIQTLKDLVMIDVELRHLKKKVAKIRQKGGNYKKEMKEYNYLIKLRKRGLRVLRKRLGLRSSKNAYKRHYQAVRGMIDRDRGTFDSFSGFDFGNEYDPYNEDDEYDYDDYENSSELEDFQRMMMGGRGGSSNRRIRRPRSRRAEMPPQYNPYDSSPLFPEKSSLDDYLEDDPEGFMDDWDDYKRSRTFFTDEEIDEDDDAYYDDLSDMQSAAIQAQISLLTKSMKDITAAVSDIQDTVAAFKEVLEEVEIDEEDIVDGEAKEYMDRINKFEDPYEEIQQQTENAKKGIMSQQPVDTMSREQLIDEINASEPDSIEIKEDAAEEATPKNK